MYEISLKAKHYYCPYCILLSYIINVGKKKGQKNETYISTAAVGHFTIIPLLLL